MKPAELLPQVDRFLAERGLRLDAVVAGGTALALLGIIQRETRDCDLLEPPLTEDLLRAAAAFATTLRDQGQVLRDDWLNNGPASPGPLLPEGWKQRLRLVHDGKALQLWSLGRPELLLAKLWALCDRGLDLGDCLALRPSSEELAEAETWIIRQDLNPDWPTHVHSTLGDLAGRLGHGL